MGPTVDRHLMLNTTMRVLLHRVRLAAIKVSRNTKYEANIHSRIDIFSDRRLQKSKHGNNCARSSEQQDIQTLG